MGLICASCKRRWKKPASEVHNAVKCPGCGRTLIDISQKTTGVLASASATTAVDVPKGQLAAVNTGAPATPLAPPLPTPRIPTELLAAGAVAALLLIFAFIAVLAANHGGRGEGTAIADGEVRPVLDTLPPGDVEAKPGDAAGQQPAAVPPRLVTEDNLQLEDNDDLLAQQAPGDTGVKGQATDKLLPADVLEKLALPSFEMPKTDKGGLTIPDADKTPKAAGGHVNPFIVALPGDPVGKYNSTVMLPGVGNKNGNGPVTLPKPAEGAGNKPSMVPNIEFMGTKASGRRFCFICDRSGSMRAIVRQWDARTRQPVMMGLVTRMQALQTELAKSLVSLPAGSQFCVIFFDTTVTLPPTGAAWQNGGTADVNHAIAWIRTIGPRGGTLPASSFQLAFQHLKPRPDVIFFMTDGGIPNNTPALVAQLNAMSEPKVVVNTIMFGSPISPFQPLNPLLLPPTNYLRKLFDIAQYSGGTFRDFHYVINQ